MDSKENINSEMHTCSNYCTRLPCVQRREIDKLKEELAEKDAVLEPLLPEIYCLYAQAGFGRLDRADDMDVVKIKYNNADRVVAKYKASRE